MTEVVYQDTRYGGPTALPGKEVRCGAFRESMRNNPLLTSTKVGQVSLEAF